MTESIKLMKSMALIGLIAFTVSPAHGKPLAYSCQEETGGWCESNGRCYANTKAPATYLLVLNSLPGDGDQTFGIFTECRNGKCGDGWEYRLEGKMMSIVGRFHAGGETIEINRSGGRFVYSTTQLASVGARVNSTFGHCSVVDG